MRLPHTLVNTSPARSLNAGPAFTHLNEREPMPRQPQLTPRQLAIVDTVRSLLASRGYPPTVREIGDSVGLKSPSSVKHQLDSLIQLGIFSHDPRRSRTLEVTPLGMSLDTETGEYTRSSILHSLPSSASESSEFAPATATVSVPLVGRIAAGAPILADQHIEDVFALPRQLTGSGELFMLQVSGDSMVDAAICDGDWVVVRRQPNAEQGEIVAAMIDGEATVKVLSRTDGHQWLLPRNPDYSPIPADNAQIIGRIVTVLRSL
ncbi:transcriptional repressor LexA [Arcanobacterium haemolyticum]|uniref:LexA repressor n=2 Tax=Arcanobacterium haemolyticum TaxID=28264 RepID=D7BN91_ARCHD|nr:transcriptional repressor, LexA family [Arcanobacterium haemolyticum DSM 20595]SPT75887.1 LexA repressor [Arcanobacterium haemolyticum]SQH28882.1 LexA repressor [Arcanobacterium haemolyticum]